MATLWDTILTQASSKADLTVEARNVAVLGDAGGGKHRLVAALVGAKPDDALAKGVGLDFQHCAVRDAANDVVGRLGFWRLQGDAGVHGKLLEFAKADLALIVVDVSKPLATLRPSLQRWADVVGRAVPIVVVATKSDTLREEDDATALHAVLRHAALELNEAALVFASTSKGTNIARLRSYIEHVLFPKQRALAVDTIAETVQHDALFVPLHWDKAVNIEGDVAAALAAAAQTAPAPAEARAAKEEDKVEAEMEQAFLLRHMKLLEAAALEEPATPSASSASSVSVSLPGTPAASAADVTTPVKPVPKPAFQTPTSASPGPVSATPVSVEDHAELANFFNSLISKDKSPYKKK